MTYNRHSFSHTDIVPSNCSILFLRADEFNQGTENHVDEIDATCDSKRKHSSDEVISVTGIWSVSEILHLSVFEQENEPKGKAENYEGEEPSYES